jgi:hypothetical protein
MSRIAKKVQPRPLLDPDDPHFVASVSTGLESGMSRKYANRWAALRLAGKIGNAHGHILTMCAGSVECFRCGGSGVLSQDAPWVLSGELLTKDCGK